MNTNISLEQMLQNKFSLVDKVNDNTYRCERSHRGSAAGVYYFISTLELPEGEGVLAFQDNLLSSDFFKSEPNIQWNYYLIFIVPKNLARSKDFDKQKLEIERDKNYARKYVIFDDELISFLQFNPFPEQTDKTTQLDIVGTWKTKLEEAGLGGLVAGESRTEIIREIISGAERETIAARNPRTRSDTSGAEATHFIEELKIVSFRGQPEKKEFRFGAVNLIFGQNGVGKTSLLEAIEHFYCGGTKRLDSKPTGGYDVKVRFKNQSEFVSYQARQNTHYQALDLSWYGKVVPRGNSLPLSFSQYNFFNADAAYHLEKDSRDDDELIESSFTELALGQEANSLWQRIIALDDDLTTKVSQCRQTVEKLLVEQESDQKLLVQYQQTAPNLDALLLNLQNGLRDIRWKLIPADITSVTDVFMKSWFDAVSSLNSINQNDKFLQLTPKELLVRQSSLKAFLLRIKEASDVSKMKQERVNHLESSQKTNLLALSLLQKIRRYTTTSFPSLVEESKILEEELAAIRNKVGPSDAHVFTLQSLESQLMASEVAKDLRSSIQNLDVSLKAQATQLEAAEKASKETEKVLAQMRTLGLRIVKSSPNGQVACPLCQMPHEKSKLENHIESELGSNQASSAFATLKLKLAEQATAKQNAEEKFRALDSFLSFFGQDSSTQSIGDMVASLKKIRDRDSTASKRYADLQKQFSSFQEVGLSIHEWKELVSAFQANATLRLEEIDAQKIETRIKLLEEQREKDRSESERLAVEIEESLKPISQENSKLLGTEATNFAQMADGVSKELESSLVVSRSLEKLGNYVTDFSNLLVRDCVNKVNEVASVVNEISSVLSSNLTRSSASADLTARIEKRKKEEEIKVDELKRLAEAKSRLEQIRTTHSKEGALHSFIEKNRETINDIFMRIHSPREFLGLAPSGLRLLRTNNLEPSSLSELSTGQRAAIALSTFFALNFNVTAAPPIILIDDPIAHVDDLNALAFLDFLKEVAIMGNRQIFFATADDKIAALFKRKFSFLGDSFVCETLRRSPVPVKIATELSL